MRGATIGGMRHPSDPRPHARRAPSAEPRAAVRARSAVALALGLAAALAVAGCAGTQASPGGSPGSPGSGGAIGPVAGLPDEALAVMNSPAYASGSWAISVQDLDTGETLVSLDADRLVEPGSVVKTYSVGAAWQLFGPDHRVTTPVVRTGDVSDGVLAGDLVLVGAGDLTMGGRTKPDGTVDFADLDHNDANAIPGAQLTPEDPLAGIDDLARQVRASGITSVTGDVLVDDRLWDAHELADEPITPIIVNNNVIDLVTTPGAVGATAAVEMRPVVAPWRVTSRVSTVAAGGTTRILVTSPSPGVIELTGTIAADSAPTVNVHAVDDPASFARSALIAALGRAGVSVAADPAVGQRPAALPAKDAVSGLPVVASLRSLPLEQEARYTLKVSYNRGAETYMCLLAVAAGSTDCEAGFAKAREIWAAAGLDTTGASLIDGSGLEGNLVTPANQVSLQAIMAARPDAERWKQSLPVLGVDGSLALVQASSPAAGHVWAKTGSLGQPDLLNDRLRLPAKALGGYIDAASGRRLVFMIVVSNGLFADIQGVFAANDDVGRVAALIQQHY